MSNDQNDTYALPPAETLRQIERVQTENGERLRAKRRETLLSQDAQELAAAQMIQRNYRGYRARRALKGYDLDPSTRWLEALKEAHYINQLKPRSRQETISSVSDPKQRVRTRWRRAGAAIYRAGSDDTSESDEGDLDDASRKAARMKRREAKAEREKYAKIMGLEYFLEMVDQKHRYGSNLRRYHQEWKQSESRDNFFYWLDEGDGRQVDLEDRPRKRLDTEMVRYLSREERRRYLVVIDNMGRFCWDKDGSPITTSVDFKDSIDGIVPANDSTPTWREVTTGEKPPPSSASSDSSSDSSGAISTGSHEDTSKYGNDELHNAKGVDKLNHVSVDSIMNHLLRKTTKKNTWIFVADTSFRLYIGIKQSGAFQHSSFLKGARVSAAGLIKIKRGQIRQLSPLSGHYAPPVKNFRKFIETLREHGADLTRLNVSRSYAVILGLEGYLGVKKQVGHAGQGIRDVFQPEAKRRREEEERDKSESARLERQFLEKQAQEQRSKSMSLRIKKKIGLDDGGE